MEPMVPEEASHALEDKAFTLTGEANQLAGGFIPSFVPRSVISSDQ